MDVFFNSFGKLCLFFLNFDFLIEELVCFLILVVYEDSTLLPCVQAKNSYFSSSKHIFE